MQSTNIQFQKGTTDMSRLFNPKNMYKLDSPERRKILPPEDILEGLALTEGDVFIDIGGGTGYFSIPASKIVGSKGKIFALDTSIEMINELKSRISENKITNITVLQSQKYKLPIPDCTGTFVLASSVLHEVEDGKKLLTEVYRVLCPGGRLCVIEWQKKEIPEGPPIEHKLDATEVQRAIEKAGFVFKESFIIGEFFIAYTAVKE
jgi:ubiquinone/menaquinone biosynthesis C-methylase UbiE